MYNTLITDLDGTLLREDHDIADETVKLLNKLNKMGVKIVLATGRNYVDALRVRNKLDFIPALITSNGAELTDEKDNLVFKNYLKEDIVNKLFEIDYKKISKDIYLNAIEEDDWIVLEEYPKNHKILEWCTDEWYYVVKDVNDVDNKKLLKLYFFGENKDLLELLDLINEKVGDRINYAFTLPFCLEVFPKGIDKGNALKELSKISKIDFERAVAFGDGFNDVEMLKLAKKGYVMGNAPQALKDHLVDFEVVGKNSEKGLDKKVKEIFGVE